MRQKLSGVLEWVDASFQPEPTKATDILFVLDVEEGLADFQEFIDAHVERVLSLMETVWHTDIRAHNPAG